MACGVVFAAGGLVPDILRYWREDDMARFALTQVAVVDYAMPAMSGLRVLGEHDDRQVPHD